MSNPIALPDNVARCCGYLTVQYVNDRGLAPCEWFSTCIRRRVHYAETVEEAQRKQFRSDRLYMSPAHTQGEVCPSYMPEFTGEAD